MSDIIYDAIELALAGRWNELADYIDEHPDLANARAYGSEGLLKICARLPGSAAVLRKLVFHGANVNDGAEMGETPLSEAISGGSRYGLTTIPEIIALVELGADINAFTYNGMPALHRTIQTNRLDYAKVLLELGADPFILTKSDPQRTAEQLALESNSPDAAELLQLIRRQRRAE